MNRPGPPAAATPAHPSRRPASSTRKRRRGNPYYDLEVSPTTEVALAGMRPVDRAQEQKWGTQRGDTEAGLDRRAPSPYSESAEVPVPATPAPAPGGL